jgi:ubiquinone/menaquinone biosynthesis C-methylase UbiE
MKPDPSYAAYLQKWAELYESLNYDGGMAGYFLSKSHEWCESSFGEEDTFPKVLEVGAGTAKHLKYVRHKFNEYFVTDLNTPMLDRIDISKLSGKVIVEKQDASRLSYENESFDRVIATHVLEHMPNPHIVLREWFRVLKPGGVLSLVLPCDPGMAWRLGRTVGSRSRSEKAGIPYDYWMAREHINPINGLVSFVRYYFDSYEEKWLPFRIPSMDLNLFYIAHIRKNS